MSQKKEADFITKERYELNLGKGASLFVNSQESELVG